MITYHFKLAIRRLLVNKKFTFLNLIKVVGLSLALSGILLIALYLKNELSYDTFHEKSDRIYRFTVSNKVSGQHFARVYRPGFIPELTQKTPGVVNYARLVPFRGGVLKHNDNYININQGFHCDSTFFEVFDAELLVGNPETVLDKPGSMVVSESFAKRTFGDMNPIGETVTRPKGQFYSQEEHFTIQGVMKDIPQNSHFHPEFLIYPSNKGTFKSWAWTYLVLSETTDPEDVEQGIKDYYVSKQGEDVEEQIEIFLQNITDIHLHSHKLREIETNSDVSVIYTFFIAAVVLLLIALINFANLNIGMASFSDRYLFISKTFGASMGMNLKYFLTESLVVLLASLILSSFIIIPVQNLIQQYFNLDLISGNVGFVLVISLLFSFLVLVSGLMPVFRYLLQYLKSFSGYGTNNALQSRGMSKPLLVFQYTISIVLIIAVVIIHKQTRYAMEKGMGAQKNNLICMEHVHTNVQKKFKLFKSELLRHKSVKSVSAMMENPGGEINDKMKFTMEGFNPDESDEIANWITILPCDYSFASIFDLNFIAGENFSKNNDEHKGLGEYIINESAMKKLNYTNASEIIGKEFKLHFDRGKIDIPRGKIIGVVEDFHFSSLKRKIQPMVLFKREAMWLMNFIISYTPGMKEQALKDIKKVWSELYPGYPMQYQYVTSMYDDVYRTELIQARLLSVFTFIALFICSMGLLGMSLLLTQRKEKEIGIRKVNGARTREVIRMLNWQLLKWVVISFLLAVPIAFFAMNQWLQNFAYKTSLSWWIFALAGLIAIVVAFVTVSLNSWRAATRNPTDVLRDE